ncbi:MAG: carbon-nitrogen hydrolase family protein [Pseudomonadota bacterium]
MRWSVLASSTRCWLPEVRAALLQLTAGDDPEANLPVTLSMIAEAAQGGAEFVATPEVTNIVSLSKARQDAVLHTEDTDPTLAALRTAAREHRIWLPVGSLALRGPDRFANRSFMITPDGQIAARYDKIHMFDVSIDADEKYRESARYAPGTQATLVDTPLGAVGMMICYDMRFPALSSALTRAGARVLLYPSAFSPVTGAAHWESLLRARAIENGAWVIAAAQTGTHVAAEGPARKTHGHSLVIDPWGTVMLDAGTDAGVYRFDLDPSAVDDARARIPALANARAFEGPNV